MVLTCSVCPSPWYKYSHQGQFQVTDLMSWNVKLGRGVSNQLVRAALAHHWAPHGLLHQDSEFLLKQ